MTLVLFTLGSLPRPGCFCEFPAAGLSPSWVTVNPDFLTVPFSCDVEAAEARAPFLPGPGVPGGLGLTLAVCLPTDFQCFLAREVRDREGSGWWEDLETGC